jgi:hypothetical protein
MASEIVSGDKANEYGHRIIKDTVLMFEVRYDPRRQQVVFLGTDVLTAVLTQGIEVEKYITEKIAQARERLVKTQ